MRRIPALLGKHVEGLDFWRWGVDLERIAQASSMGDQLSRRQEGTNSVASAANIAQYVDTHSGRPHRRHPT